MASYRGDAFEDEPYAEWACSLCEQARNAYAEALHELLSVHRADGDEAAAPVMSVSGGSSLSIRTTTSPTGRASTCSLHAGDTGRRDGRQGSMSHG